MYVSNGCSFFILKLPGGVLYKQKHAAVCTADVVYSIKGGEFPGCTTVNVSTGSLSFWDVALRHWVIASRRSNTN